MRNGASPQKVACRLEDVLLSIWYLFVIAPLLAQQGSLTIISLAVYQFVVLFNDMAYPGGFGGYNPSPLRKKLDTPMIAIGKAIINKLTLIHAKFKNTGCEVPGKKVLLAEIEKARQILHEKVLNIGEYESSVICSRDTESSNTINAIADLKNAFQKLEVRVSVLEGKSPSSSSSNSNSLNQDIEQLKSLMEKLEARVTSLESKKTTQSSSKPEEKETPKVNDEEDDDVDLFGSDSENVSRMFCLIREESEEAAKLKAQRVAEYSARKSKKPTLIAKSNIILDVKPWDDETDMKELEKAVRQVATDGLLWGALKSTKLVPLAYGIHKLQISCVVEDEKVSIDWLQETLQEIEDYKNGSIVLTTDCVDVYKIFCVTVNYGDNVTVVEYPLIKALDLLESSLIQSVDIAAFNKI
ncbi:hypothetical protein AGLY_014878 [Aphis glycines]|uniref:Translation elongation factor EF1B beta/delta subunit guanine nucleotide exchange domain-containing protein n=1 Tax=Aphis glycines TaxID=307491 RepID=A0A6G0T342_APHGL|nr:hypothetical protein AGLY_014878 [Aphis glycines]